MWDRNLFDIVYFDIQPHEVAEFVMQREAAIEKLNEFCADNKIHPDDYKLQVVKRPYVFTTKAHTDWVHKYNDRILTSSSALTDPDWVISYDGEGGAILDYMGNGEVFPLVTLHFFADGDLEVAHMKNKSVLKAQYVDFKTNYLDNAYIEELHNLVFKVCLR